MRVVFKVLWKMVWDTETTIPVTAELRCSREGHKMVAMSLLRPAFGQGARAVLLRGSAIASRNQLASPPVSAG